MEPASPPGTQEVVGAIWLQEQWFGHHKFEIRTLHQNLQTLHTQMVSLSGGQTSGPLKNIIARQVFSKDWSLLSDCSINLLPGTTIPRGHLFSLLVPENKAMDEHISDLLAAHLSRPSSSPASAGSSL